LWKSGSTLSKFPEILCDIVAFQLNTILPQSADDIYAVSPAAINRRFAFVIKTGALFG
jgi:hypothetical protein